MIGRKLPGKIFLGIKVLNNIPGKIFPRNNIPESVRNIYIWIRAKLPRCSGVSRNLSSWIRQKLQQSPGTFLPGFAQNSRIVLNIYELSFLVSRKPPTIFNYFFLNSRKHPDSSLNFQESIFLDSR